MTTRNVHAFCAELWEAREEARLPGAAVISRGLALAVAADVTASTDYEPHVDRRIVWAEALVKGRRYQRPEVRPEAPEAVEATAAYLLGKDFQRELDAKQRAAGEGKEEMRDEPLEIRADLPALALPPNSESQIPNFFCHV